jgi:hypothetical protein
MTSKRPKFFAWVGHSSIAVGNTIPETVAMARALVNTPRWQQFEPGFPQIRVRTYGAQCNVGIFSSDPDDDVDDIKGGLTSKEVV